MTGWTGAPAASLIAGLPGGKPGPDTRARGGNNTWAPDMIRVGDKILSCTTRRPARSRRPPLACLSRQDPDPQSPNFKWTGWRTGGVVRRHRGQQRPSIRASLRVIQPTARLWLVYGSYFGYIRLVELDPKTGQRTIQRTATNVAINAEAPILISRDGWYYLLVNHGSCCAGANSTYNIRMGRSAQGHRALPRQHGRRHARRRRQAVRRIARAPRRTGPLRPAGSRRMACRNSRCTTKPTWIAAAAACSTSGRCCGATAGRWPATTSRRHLLDRIGPHRHRAGTGRAGRRPSAATGASGWRTGGPPAATGSPGSDAPGAGQLSPPAISMRVSARHAAGPAEVDDHTCHRRRWLPGSPYFRIGIAAQRRVLAAAPCAKSPTLPAFQRSAGAVVAHRSTSQIGHFAYFRKRVPGTDEVLAFPRVDGSTPTARKFDPSSDRQRWRMEAP